MSIQILSPRQLKAFKRHRVGYFSMWVVAFYVVVALCSNLIANDKPLFMRINGNTYFPIVSTVTNKDLGIQSDMLAVDFRSLREARKDDAFFIMPLIPFHPNESDRTLESLTSAPSSRHWMGTDDRGRDVLSRLIHGLKNSLLYAVTVWLFSYLIGMAIGAIQGFFGGWVDLVMQRVIEIITSLPSFFLLIIISSIIQPGLWTLAAISVIIGGWVNISYYVRAEFLKLRQLEFIEASRSLGVGRPRIIFRHILPNALTPVITFTPFSITGNITGLTGLDFLGFGLPAPMASWGELLNQALSNFDHAWWLAFFPCMAIISTLLALVLFGEAVREALDPRAAA